MTSDSQEQNKRTMRAIILCVLVAVVYTQVFLNKKRPVEQVVRPVASPIAASSTPLNVAANVQPSGATQLIPANAPAVRHPGKSELAGSSADGVLISAASSVEFVRWSMDHVNRGAAGRKVHAAGLVYGSVGVNRAEAGARVRRMLATLPAA